jgi:undecaprenyl-diphosphatase
VSVPPDDGHTVTRTRAAAAVVTGCVLLALLGLGVATEFDPQMTLDAEVSEAVYAGDGRAGLLDGLLEVLTAPGLTVFRLAVFLPVVVWLLVRRTYPTVLWVLAAIILIVPVTQLLKNSFDRVRPDFEDGGARYSTLSFPSGHSTGIAVLVTVALVLAWPLLAPQARRWWLAIGIALVVLVGLTRMWLGVHYLSDVVGGWALGTAWTLLVALLLGGLPGGRAALRPRTREPVP